MVIHPGVARAPKAMNSLIKTRLIRHMANRNQSLNIIKRGFTLVELMVVIVIVGILSAVALPNFLSQTNKAKATECTTNIGAMLSQVSSEFQLDPGDADSLADDLITTANGSSTHCTFSKVAALTDTSTVFGVNAVGKATMASKYDAKSCINLSNMNKNIETDTTDGTPAAAAAAASCP